VSQPSRSPQEVELLARLMDNALRLPGTNVRFGLDSIVGLIPGAGDAATSLVSLYILSAANRYGVARATQLRMAANIAIDAVVGAVPVLGDLFDLYWKANLRNAELLRRHLAAEPKAAAQLRKRDQMFLGAIIVLTGALLVASIVATYFIVTWAGRWLGRFVG
jgi:hypothetical protein